MQSSCFRFRVTAEAKTKDPSRIAMAVRLSGIR
jgi:hypothetical protein